MGQAKLILLDMVATVHVQRSPSPSPASSPPSPQLRPGGGRFTVKVVTRVNMSAAGAVQFSVAGNWSSSAAVTRTLHLPAGVSEVAEEVRRWRRVALRFTALAPP